MENGSAVSLVRPSGVSMVDYVEVFILFSLDWAGLELQRVGCDRYFVRV